MPSWSREGRAERRCRAEPTELGRAENRNWSGALDRTYCKQTGRNSQAIELKPNRAEG
jgi:hypothetical protein